MRSISSIRIATHLFVVAVCLTSSELAAQSLQIDTTTLPDGNFGAEYTAFVTSSGGSGTEPHRYRLVSGKLPKGLKMERAFGVQSTLIHGVPTEEGTSTFTVQVSDGAETATQTLSITILGPEPLLINNPSPLLREGTVGEPYAANLFAIGGVPPYDWEITAGELPPGLRLRDNVITGTPTTAGTFVFTATLTDRQGTQATQEFTIVVN